MIKMPFKKAGTTVDNQIADWSCTDGFQEANYYGEDPNDVQIDDGGYQNCYIYRNGSNINDTVTGRRLDSHETSSGNNDGGSGNGNSGNSQPSGGNSNNDPPKNNPSPPANNNN